MEECGARDAGRLWGTDGVRQRPGGRKVDWWGVLQLCRNIMSRQQVRQQVSQAACVASRSRKRVRSFARYT